MKLAPLQALRAPGAKPLQDGELVTIGVLGVLAVFAVSISLLTIFSTAG
jgi:hypothetical protein